jgi:hypothetical protein
VLDDLAVGDPEEMNVLNRVGLPSGFGQKMDPACDGGAGLRTMLPSHNGAAGDPILIGYDFLDAELLSELDESLHGPLDILPGDFAPVVLRRRRVEGGRTFRIPFGDKLEMTPDDSLVVFEAQENPPCRRRPPEELTLLKRSDNEGRRPADCSRWLTQKGKS